MRLPIIKGGNSFKKSIVAFGGMNLTRNFSEGELCSCSGISHLSFPAITQRRKSETVFECSYPTNILFCKKECFIADGALYYDRKKVAVLSDGEKILVALGNKIAVFPDKIFYDTETGETGDLQGECSSAGAPVTFSNNSISLPSEYSEQTTIVEKLTFEKDTAIITYESVTVQDLTMSFSGFELKTAESLTPDNIFREKCEMNQYRRVIGTEESADGKSRIVECELVTVRNCLQGVFSQLKAGDMVEISGCSTCVKNNRSAEIISVRGNQLMFPDETFTQASESSVISIKRKIPDFTCACSYENRLWGCEGNTIYASALGDMTNFFTYKNLSTDSYSIMSNSAGDFTACIPYGNSCLFFKEDRCYKLYGNRPSNFQLTESFGAGILSSDAKSIVNINGTIVYKGSGGIYVYYGGTPGCVSRKLEGVSMENAVCGSDGKCCYISADTKDGREEFVWDMEKNLWSKSGINDALGYGYHGAVMYRLRPFGIEKILEEADENADWSITLCPFDEGYYKTKNYSRIYVHAHLYENAYIHAQISRDDGVWEDIDTCYADEKKYINIPCVVKSCHSVKLRFSGKGKCVLESITREFSVN